MGGLDKDKILRMDKYKNVVLRLRFADKSLYIKQKDTGLSTYETEFP